MTDEQLADIADYWLSPPKERDAKFGTWPIRSARQDIGDLLAELEKLGRRIAGGPSHQTEMEGMA